ncbi:TIGR01906 family membrane protein [Actinomyces sp. zg-332]|uniref:TIGR01906 family membrane protein n=1 Tax=Actinomyces sp. zg-332 TaxID=2708340 RepID=UPI001420372F|nr:TIGR01906 family membrane protein [Actinomyces sp. zg-332]QPK94304.1 TIGR01906 family membrane protein [Actinomyces sp. zg-332]
MKNFHISIVRIINYLSVTLGFLFLAVSTRAFDISYYEKQFTVNDTPSVTGKSMQELLTIANDLIKYMILGESSLLTPHFSKKEVLHMSDVYGLFSMMYIAQFVIVLLLILSFAYSKKTNQILDNMISLRKSINITYILVIVFAILLSQFDFTQLFIYFHQVFFSNNLWILNPNTDLMIQMLPEQFFSRIALEILITWIVMNIVTQIILTLIIRKKNPKKNKEITELLNK